MFSMHMIRFLFPVFLLLISQPVYAEDGSGARPERSAVSTVPEAGENGSARLVVDRRSAADFRDLIIPELFPFVKDDLLKIPVVRAPGYQWALDSAWEQASGAPWENADLLVSEGGAKEIVAFRRSLPFGRAAAVSGTADSKLQAGKVLWNTNAMWWSQRSLQMDFNLIAIENGEVKREGEATLGRIYPPAIDGSVRHMQLFRELFRLLKPASPGPFSFLTFRLLPVEEDLLWEYSPAVNRVRQLTGSNRGDPFLTFAFSLDDLLGWSGKPGLVDADVIGSREFFLPFAAVSTQPLRMTSTDDSGNPCFSVELSFPSGKGSAVDWNLEVPRGPGEIILPAAAIFIPRTAWRIEISTRDPYSLSGRQILYIDQETMLPAVNVVFDRAGKLWKVVISAFGLAVAPDRRVPFQAWEVVADIREGKAALMTPTRIIYCDAYQPGMGSGDFDPSRIGPSTGSGQGPSAGSGQGPSTISVPG